MKLSIPKIKNFTDAALRRWDALDPKEKAEILNNAYCGLCRKKTHIQVGSAKISGRDLFLYGYCGRCGFNAVEIVEKKEKDRPKV